MINFLLTVFSALVGLLVFATISDLSQPKSKRVINWNVGWDYLKEKWKNDWRYI